MAQHARPNVMGQSADLRAQLTTGAAISTVFAPTLRRIEFMIESTVVKTNPSSCSAIYHFQFAIADCQIGNWQLKIGNSFTPTPGRPCATRSRSEERRVGKECRS